MIKRKTHLGMNGWFDPRAALIWLSQFLLLALSLHLVISTFFVKTSCCFLSSFMLFDLRPLLENVFHMCPLAQFCLSKQFLSRLRPWIFRDLWKDLSGSTLSSLILTFNSPFQLTCPYFLFFFIKNKLDLFVFSSCTLKTSSQTLCLGLGCVYKLRSPQINSRPRLGNCVTVKRKLTNVKRFLLFDI